MNQNVRTTDNVTFNNLTVNGTLTGIDAGDVGATPLDHIRSLGTQAFTGTANTAGLISEMESDGAFDSYSSVFKTSWSYAGNFNLGDAGRFTETAGSSWITWTDNSSDSTRGNITALAIAPNTGGSAGKVLIYNDQGSGYSPGWREVWTSTSDGAGSGLDADLWDGNQFASYLNQAVRTSDSPQFARVYLDSTNNYIDTIGSYLSFKSGGNEMTFGGSTSMYINYRGALGGTPTHWIWNAGSSSSFARFTLGRLDAEVFYDRNNTGTYVDPNTTGISFQTLGQIRTTRADGFRVDSASYARIDLDSNNNWSYIRLQDNGAVSWDIASYNGGNLELRPAGGGSNRTYFDSSGNSFSETSKRAPIFYDSNNTGLYVDPAGTSQMLNINMNNGSLTNVNAITINDPGDSEGIQWNGGSGWRIYESPDNMSNAAGNLQFSIGTSYRFRVDTSGNTFSST